MQPEELGKEFLTSHMKTRTKNLTHCSYRYIVCEESVNLFRFHENHRSQEILVDNDAGFQESIASWKVCHYVELVNKQRINESEEAENMVVYQVLFAFIFSLTTKIIVPSSATELRWRISKTAISRPFLSCLEYANLSERGCTTRC